jgi:ABC-type transport system involved in multi-copper enzyme maturation permease subunit
MVIARVGLKSFFARRAFLALLLFSWLPFLIRAVQVYLAATLPQASFLALTPGVFRQFLRQQDIFVFFITVYAGAGLIANDRSANALQIYLSKPIGRAEYVFGKLAVLITLLLLITWVPSFLLLIVQMALTGSIAFLRANLFLLPAITLFCALESLVGATSMLALSSLSRSSRYAGMLYAALIFFSQAVAIVLRTATGNVWWLWISMPNSVTGLGDAIFGLPSGLSRLWPTELAAILGLLALSALILERRVRGIEVVS